MSKRAESIKINFFENGDINVLDFDYLLEQDQEADKLRAKMDQVNAKRDLAYSHYVYQRNLSKQYKSKLESIENLVKESCSRYGENEFSREVLKITGEALEGES